MAKREDGTPWWADFPEPKSIAARVDPEDVFRLLQDQQVAQGRHRDFLLVDEGIKRVVFYCGSSLGRGPRCAAWLQDYVNEAGGDLKSEVMVGGVRGWVQAYGGGMMDGYDEKAWRQER
ncbi:hypothetical protein N657DRAFT_653100 [Parathielavia appendiculata]|uniref:Rhodanese domain-containing protein n=1 Tax=Parathielavia appendiculata TaxID=2587402 RepID=A0AAN6Z9H4_9PEZI|nr:hypothetical protein N657DRAFT_653100 [Parathielavia appendiculata]